MVIHGAATGIVPADIHRTTESFFDTGNGRVIGAPLRMRRPEDQSPSAASAGLMMEVWASSVASWFLRPEMAGAGMPPIVPPPMPIRPSRTSSDPPQMAMPPTICTAIRCTVPGCVCDCFTPGKLHIRFCDACGHGWVPHALDKLGFGGASLGNGAVEPIQPNVAFDIASLVLYGCQALPIRLKILLDRLFSVLRQEEVSAVLRGFGWTHEDYARGYIHQEPLSGGILERWNICSPEEEPLVLQQFLRFGETRAVTQQLLLHGLGADFRILPALETDMKRLMECQKLQLNNDHKSGFDMKFRSRSPPAPQSIPPPPLLQPPQRLPLVSSPASPPKPMFGFAKPSGGMPPLQPPPIGNNACNGAGSPPVGSPTSSVSPLNKLQNMQPFDFRKMQSAAAGFMGGKHLQAASDRRSNNSSVDLLPPPPRHEHQQQHLQQQQQQKSPQQQQQPSPPQQQQQQPQQPQQQKPQQNDFNSKYGPADSLAGSSEFGSDDGDDEEDNSQSALNLTKDNILKAMRPHRGHGRKTTLPLKRQWGSAGLPLNLGTQLINPATGKKRVQCNVCLKTFCDKGALKIHFSAVHLREMHKCTVEGCNMMFSSRRSRNRHSANPNPKLHSPHLRRKISPHDGRSSQAHHPMVMTPLQASAINQLAFGAFPLLTGGTDLRGTGSKHSSASGLHLAEELRRSAELSSDNMDEYMDDEEDGIVVDGNAVDDDEDDSEHRSDRSCKLEQESDDDEEAGSMMNASDAQNDDHDHRNNDNHDHHNNNNNNSINVKKNNDNENNNERPPVVTTIKNVHKRKSMNPTRFAAAADLSDEGMSYTDDGSAVASPKDSNPNADSAAGTVAVPVKREADEDDGCLNLSRKKRSSASPVTTAGGGGGSKDSLLSEEDDGPLEDEDLDLDDGDDDLDDDLDDADDLDESDSDGGHRVYGTFENGRFVPSDEVPVDEDDPRACKACGKTFPSQSAVKSHYQSAHMKLMHKCVVDGCNATFPSKRSRDRHSSNLNLHRKLLSTSSTEPQNHQQQQQNRQPDKESSRTNAGVHKQQVPQQQQLVPLPAANLMATADNPYGMHAEFLARLYADSQQQFQAFAGGNGLLQVPPRFPGSVGSPFGHLPAAATAAMAMAAAAAAAKGSTVGGNGRLVYSADEDLPPAPDKENGMYACRFCGKSFPDKNGMREHYEQLHMHEMHRCKFPGCGMVFSSRTKRNVHAENSHQPALSASAQAATS